jgi:hypothetical protein
MSDVICELAPFQEHFITSNERVVSIIAGKGAGKAQPLTEPVLTPLGFVPMGLLRVGDKVIGSDGKPHNVTGVFPQGLIDNYLVTMSDGTHTYCNGEHLWAVQTGGQKARDGGYKVYTTEWLSNNLKTGQGYNKWYLPLVEPVRFEHKELPVPPYALGAILGDGGLTKNEVTFSTADMEILDRVATECEISYKHRSKYDYALTNGERDSKGHNTNHLVTALRELGLMGKKSDKKSIPDIYLYASPQQRLALICGLMDTDGYCDRRGVGYFTTTSEQMANQFVFLCRSMGLTTDARKKDGKGYLDSYNIRVNAFFNPFFVKRKADKFNVYATQGRTKSIKSITYAGKCEMQCISVDAPDSLYVTRDFILTHNTWTGARFVAYQCVMQPNSQGLVMLNSRQQVLDIFEQDIRPLLDELKWPYALNAQALNLKILNSVVHLRSADPDAVKKVESIAYHWGWADEASYYPSETLKTFVSRIRKGDAMVRVTSMPDEPDAFMYSFLENLGGRMYELGLKDNPDKEFAERYERFLRATYSGPQLERFLSGKRVSLTGMGIFAVESHQRIPDATYDPNLDVHVVWDFNVEYRAVSAWQDFGIAPDGNKKTACVLSWRLNNATVYEDAEWLSDFFANHNANIILNGDASGESRTAQTTDSMWKTIRDVFNRKLPNVRYITPKSNPSVKDTIQCVNWALKQGLVFFNESERNVYMSLSACRADKYGEIDKAMDYQANSNSRSHEADTARYHIFQTYKHVYPGNKGGFFIV